MHRLAYAGGSFSLEDGSGRVIGPPGEPDKDGIVFNLRDGRVALIHRIYPNMQLAVFDSLEQLWDPPQDYWETHMADLDRHTIIRPLETSLGVGAGAPPVVTGDGLLLLFHERDGHERYSTRAALLVDGSEQRLRKAPLRNYPGLKAMIAGDRRPRRATERIHDEEAATAYESPVPLSWKTTHGCVPTAPLARLSTIAYCWPTVT